VMPGTTVFHLQGCLDHLLSGELAAGDELLTYSRERLRILVERMLSHGPRLHRRDEPDEVLRAAFLSVGTILDPREAASVRAFLCRSACNIRETLIDLLRRYDGPDQIGANHATSHPGQAVLPDQTATAPNPERSGDTLSLADWTSFHKEAARLPDEAREVLDLLYYHDLAQDEAAKVLGISLGILKRRWQSARLTLMESLGTKSKL
jgi:DNA-directed RNA polymerase specialized sigma24 family protein